MNGSGGFPKRRNGLGNRVDRARGIKIKITGRSGKEKEGEKKKKLLTFNDR